MNTKIPSPDPPDVPSRLFSLTRSSESRCTATLDVAAQRITPHYKRGSDTLTLKTLCLSVGLGVAVLWDLRHQRIPNVLTVSLAALGLVLATVEGGMSGALDALLGLIIGFAFFFIPFILGGIGGGDVKLMAAVGAMSGYALTLHAGVYTALAGGLIAAVMLARRGRLLLTLRRVGIAFWLLLIGQWRLMRETLAGPGGSSDGPDGPPDGSGGPSDGPSSGPEVVAQASPSGSFPYAIAIAAGTAAAWFAAV